LAAHAYGAYLAIADNSSTITDGLDIYTSSDHYDVSKTLGIERQADVTILFFNRHHTVFPPKQGSNEIISRRTMSFFVSSGEI